MMNPKAVTLIPLQSQLIQCGDELSEMIHLALQRNQVELQDGDILAIASKVISATQCRLVALEEVEVSPLAVDLSTCTGLDSRFVQIILQESKGRIYGLGPGFILCDSSYGVCSNAGIDNSNAPPGQVYLWPKDLELELSLLHSQLQKDIGLLVIDSRSIPGRKGSTGVTLASYNVQGLIDERGKYDLYKRPLTLTVRALADQLASACELVMGETTELIPFVIIRGTDLVDGSQGYQVYHDKLPIERDIYVGSILNAIRRSSSDDPCYRLIYQSIVSSPVSSL